MQFRNTIFAAALGLVAFSGTAGRAQLAQRKEPASSAASRPPVPHRMRLILKDGSYQIVMGYTIAGKNVRYISAERGGETEEIPLALVDLAATERWEAQHVVVDPDAAAPERKPPAIDPELLKEEASRAALAPEVAPDLRLPPEDNVLALDTFRSEPELVPLTQSDGELNKQTAHNILRATVNPLASSHQIVVLKGERAAVQLHVNDPVLYLKLDDELPSSGEALTVNTHGASSQDKPRRPRVGSDYVIVRTDVRQDARVVASVNLSLLGTAKRQEDVIETDSTILAGGHWVRIAPRGQLLIGEYALLEILDEKTINLSVWDFGIHPTAPENRDVLKPEKRRPEALERRGANPR